MAWAIQQYYATPNRQDAVYWARMYRLAGQIVRNWMWKTWLSFMQCIICMESSCDHESSAGQCRLHLDSSTLAIDKENCLHVGHPSLLFAYTLRD